LQQSEILATNGVWYDCAAILVDLQMDEPTNANFVAAWTQLLGSVELSQLAAAELIGIVE
ncbi:MAG: DUF928 domain-containing protein, partial [Spirulinaceae cyanobacterium RM2_2_10]|nr:DUF928 domain-containing protein [Spirulinaceae cyanobacterium RM2_2_10]